MIEAAAYISAERRGARPGTWADDNYTSDDFMTVMMTAADQHEEANAQRDEAEHGDYFDSANAAHSPPVVGEFGRNSQVANCRSKKRVPCRIRGPWLVFPCSF